MYRLILTFLVALTLQSCGFTMDAENVADVESGSKLQTANLFCISEDYEVCQYFQTQYPRSIAQKFDGIIEIFLKQNKTAYTNWSETGAPRISQSVVEINYIMITNRQKSINNKGITIGQVTQNIPYQFGSSVVSDLYAQRQSKKNAVDTLINEINNVAQKNEDNEDENVNKSIIW